MPAPWWWQEEVVQGQQQAVQATVTALEILTEDGTAVVVTEDGTPVISEGTT